MAKHRHTGTFIFGAIVGGLSAAGYTLWKTPQSGANMRAMLAEQAEGMLDRVTSLGERIGVETGPNHAYPPVSTSVSSGIAPAQVTITTVEPGEGPIAENQVLPLRDDSGDGASPSPSI